MQNEHVHPRPASTVLLLRGGNDGLEVLMLKRPPSSAFAAGVYVFPGGALETSDAHIPEGRWEGIELPRRAAEMSLDEAGVLAYHVAAVRELYEEAGMLLAHDGNGNDLLNGPSLRRCEEDRSDGLAPRERAEDFFRWIDTSHLTLQLGHLAWWSWWVTPQSEKRRFDTRFFVAHAPPGQEAIAHETEVTDAVWVHPDEALAAHRRGAFPLIFPTRFNLEVLANFETADDVVRASREGRVDTRPVHAEVIVGDDGMPRVRHPYVDGLMEL